MDDTPTETPSDEPRVTEVRTLTAEVASLSADVQHLSEVQESRRKETLRIAKDLRVHTEALAKTQRAETRHRTRVISGWLAGLVISVIVFAWLVVNGLQDNAAMARDNASMARDNAAMARDNAAAIAAAITENNRRLCLVMSPFASRPGDTPPAGNPAQVARSLKIRQEFKSRIRDFGCQ